MVVLKVVESVPVHRLLDQWNEAVEEVLGQIDYFEMKIYCLEHCFGDCDRSMGVVG